MHKPLTAVAVSKMSKPGRYAAGDGVYLQVSQAGTKAWVFRYQRQGKARHMGLGPVGLVSLADAREKARDARRQLLDGLDPLERRKVERVRSSPQDGFCGDLPASAPSGTSLLMSRLGRTRSIEPNGERRFRPMPIRCLGTFPLVRLMSVWS